MPDFTLIAGDELPLFEDTLKYANGAIAEPESVTFVMRSLIAEEPLVLTGTPEVVSKAKGEVAFKPKAADSEKRVGNYMANWQTKIGGKPMTFPTTGYLWVQIQPSLASKSAVQLISLEELKDHLNIQPTDRTHDTKLERLIRSTGALVENIVGPIRVNVHDEWYEGGHTTIALRHPPSYGYGATPVLTIMAVSEYRGPIEYPLVAAPTPTQGSVYSEMVHAELGMIVRRTAGGGTYDFWRDPHHPQQSVHVVYASGQEKTPEAVEWAMLETIKVAYESTMMVGRGFQTVADQQEQSMPLGFAIPRHAMEYLEPLRRAPAFA